MLNWVGRWVGRAVRVSTRTAEKMNGMAHWEAGSKSKSLFINELCTGAKRIQCRHPSSSQVDVHDQGEDYPTLCPPPSPFQTLQTLLATTGRYWASPSSRQALYIGGVHWGLLWSPRFSSGTRMSPSKICTWFDVCLRWDAVDIFQYRKVVAHLSYDRKWIERSEVKVVLSCIWTCRLPGNGAQDLLHWCYLNPDSVDY